MSKKTVPKRRRAKPESAEKVHASSGNVFADLGFHNAADHMAKAQLAHQICLLIEKAGLSQADAAVRLGIDQPKVSALMRGRLKDFSTERLMRLITTMDHDVVIAIRNPKDEANPSVRVLINA